MKTKCHEKKIKKKHEFLDKYVEIHSASLLAKMKVTPSPSNYQLKYTKSTNKSKALNNP